MEELLMRYGVVGFCSDCGGDRLLVPVDDDGFEHCCTDCDGAVLLVQLSAPLAAAGAARKAG